MRIILHAGQQSMLIDEFNITEGVHISMDKKISGISRLWPAEAQMRQQFFLESIRCSDWGLSMTELEERG